jgi:hypothetical protein
MIVGYARSIIVRSRDRLSLSHPSYCAQWPLTQSSAQVDGAGQHGLVVVGSNRGPAVAGAAGVGGRGNAHGAFCGELTNCEASIGDPSNHHPQQPTPVGRSQHTPHTFLPINHKDVEEEGQAETARRLAASVLRAEEGLRQSLLQVGGEEEREEVLEGLRRAAEPYQAAVRSYLRSIYEADRSLTATLKEAQEQVRPLITDRWMDGWFGGSVTLAPVPRSAISPSHPTSGPQPAGADGARAGPPRGHAGCPAVSASPPPRHLSAPPLAAGPPRARFPPAQPLHARQRVHRRLAAPPPPPPGPAPEPR